MKNKPFVHGASLISGTVQTARIVGMGLLLLAALPTDQVKAEPKQPLQTNPAVSVSDADPQAVALSITGECEYSEDGVNFSHLKWFAEGKTVRGGTGEVGSVKQLWGRVFKEGTVIRTGKHGQVDLFLRRVGTTVRLGPDSEIKLAKIARTMKGTVSMQQTMLDLPKGRIFVGVRSYVTGSTIDVKNAPGHAVIGGGGGKGRYLITAEGRQVADKDADVPLKAVGDSGVTVVPPGTLSLSKESNALSAEPSEVELALITSDEMETTIEQAETK